VETEKVIRAQLFESLMTAQYLKARYDQVAIESQISLVVGRRSPEGELETVARRNGEWPWNTAIRHRSAKPAASSARDAKPLP
jgi:hypothetical protein